MPPDSSRPPAIRRLLRSEDTRWGTIWFVGIAALFLWNAFFLNAPSFSRLQVALLNSLLGGCIVVSLSLGLGWLTGVALYLLESRGYRSVYLALAFILNLLRSIPQIVGVLIGYIVLIVVLERSGISAPWLHLTWMSVVTALVVFQEMSDVIRERIDYYSKLDFMPAMLCCGITEWRIVNVEILIKNCGAHLVHKMVAIFGSALFLQCSIDFIISVGLSTDVNLSNVPLTLGSMLARMDSKQDILAVSTLFSDPAYFPRLFTTHLQGISVAICIVFTLFSVYKISNGIVKRLHL
jgi:ABC-type dipeptide/oligopeptide/nickel transport system permease subunit